MGVNTKTEWQRIGDVDMWKGMTERFGPEELWVLEMAGVAALLSALLASDPVVCLRGLAELRLHEVEAGQLDQRLTVLLESPTLTARWRAYSSDHGVDDRDNSYARDLEQQLKGRSLQTTA